MIENHSASALSSRPRRCRSARPSLPPASHFHRVTARDHDCINPIEEQSVLHDVGDCGDRCYDFGGHGYLVQGRVHPYRLDVCQRAIGPPGAPAPSSQNPAKVARLLGKGIADEDGFVRQRSANQPLDISRLLVYASRIYCNACPKHVDDVRDVPTGPLLRNFR